MGSEHTLGDLARHVGGRVEGDAGRVIRGIAVLEEAGATDLSFLTNPRYRKAAAETRAGALLVREGVELSGRDRLVCHEPYLALARLLELFYPVEAPRPGVAASAEIDPSARIAEEVSIGPFCVVEQGAELGRGVSLGAGCYVGRAATVGEESVLMPRVVLYPGTRIGRRCRIHSGAVLGADGFGFATSEGRHHKVPQLGRVVVEDDVEIGANSAVDRGTLGETVIGAGSKLDDLVMVAHGVRLGRGCLIAAQSGIAGSTTIGAGVTVAGQSGVAGHLRIADGTVIAAKSAVFSDVAAAGVVAGVPAIDHRSWKRAQAIQKRLPEMRAALRRLDSRLRALERRIGDAPREEE